MHNSNESSNWGTEAYYEASLLLNGSSHHGYVLTNVADLQKFAQQNKKEQPERFQFNVDHDGKTNVIYLSGEKVEFAKKISDNEVSLDGIHYYLYTQKVFRNNGKSNKGKKKSGSKKRMREFEEELADA